jgi:UTP--glucose-1-phosphate uridylyltransferase
MSSQKVTKAVIAAAGFGTRFLPQTKAIPKEMLPLIDKPIIQYVVEELVGAGIQDIIIVGSSNKRAIEDHFDLPNSDLVENLTNGGKTELLEETKAVANLANFIYLRQKGPYGNATPLLSAAHLLNDSPFIYAYADDFFTASPRSRFQQMIDMHEQRGGSVLSCIKLTEDAHYKRYGVVAGESQDDGTIKMSTVIEKPGRDNAPSDLATVSSYLLEPQILKYIEEAAASFDGQGELMIQPIMQRMMDSGSVFWATEIQDGAYYDTGDKLEYLKTLVDFALMHEKMGPDFRSYLEKRLQA